MSKDNPINPNIFTYTHEFQVRRAGHIHGIIWVNFDDALPNDLNNSIINLAFNKFSHDTSLNVEKEIRTMYVSDFVSPVATLSEVRKKLVSIQHQMGVKKGIVMDGRDIGTVVFPKAELKIFMTADAEVRAMRRFNELKEKDETITYDEILKNVQKRDLMDTTREDSPLIIANDAIEIDNSETNQEDQFHIILQLAKDRIAGRI